MTSGTQFNDSVTSSLPTTEVLNQTVTSTFSTDSSPRDLTQLLTSWMTTVFDDVTTTNTSVTPLELTTEPEFPRVAAVKDNDKFDGYLIGNYGITLLWRHNERGCVLNQRRLDCLLNLLFRRRSKKTSKLRVTSLCVGNFPVTGEFPAQRSSNAENVCIWWRHHEKSRHWCG